MNNPNPLVPQGSLLEQKAKSKPHLRVVFFIVAVHVVFFVGILIQGCKPEGTAAHQASTAPTNDLSLPPLDSSNSVASIPAPDPAAAPPVTGGAPAPGGAPGGMAAGGSPGGGAVPMVTQSPTLPPVGGAPVTPPAADSSLPAAGSTEYAVQKNDTLAIIAKKHGVSVKALEKANPGVDPRRLRISQKLQIPAPAAPHAAAGGTDVAGAPSHAAGAVVAESATMAYVVKPGDTLTKIAKAHGTTPKAIRAASNLKTDAIKVGQKLKLPARKVPAMSTEPPPALPSAAAEPATSAPASVPALPGAPAGTPTR
jgi:LysM repeat protein